MFCRYASAYLFYGREEKQNEKNIVNGDKKYFSGAVCMVPSLL